MNMRMFWTVVAGLAPLTLVITFADYLTYGERRWFEITGLLGLIVVATYGFAPNPHGYGDKFVLWPWLVFLFILLFGVALPLILKFG